MGDIIYIGYDVIKILDVMSYLYGCDIIKYSSDVTDLLDEIPSYSGCDVIDRVGVMTQIQWT